MFIVPPRNWATEYVIFLPGNKGVLYAYLFIYKEIILSLLNDDERRKKKKMFH